MSGQASDEPPSFLDLMELLAQYDGRCALANANGTSDPLSIMSLNHIQPISSYENHFYIHNF